MAKSKEMSKRSEKQPLEDPPKSELSDFAGDEDSIWSDALNSSDIDDDESGDSGDEESSEESGDERGDDGEMHSSAERGDISEEEGSSGHTGDDDNDRKDVLQSVEESDSSEDEVPPKNTIGEVPLKWYEEEEHIGYDVKGKKIRKQPRKDKLQSFLEGVDDSKNWRKIYDEYNDEEVELTKEETKLIRKLLKGKTPHAEVDPYAPYVDWFEWEDKGHPLSNAPEPKRRFVPSKWEQKKVVKYVRAIRKGWIKFDKPKEEPQFYLLWGDDSNAAENKRQGLSYIPAPKPKLPGHDESYNPSTEYIPSQEDINKYQLMYEEDRPKFIPRRFESLRSVPAYENAVKEGFDRCLDLYLCPRARKKRINIDPESLKPKLPNRKDLRPYPSTCYLEYRGHTGPVKSISVEASGQWIASGSTDGTVRVWEVETGRCLRVWNVGEDVQHVAWNPLPELPILAVSAGHDLILLNTGLGDAEEDARIKELLHVEESALTDDAVNNTPVVSWIQHTQLDGIQLQHFKAVSTVEWHRKGDYFTTVVPTVHVTVYISHVGKKHQGCLLLQFRSRPTTAPAGDSRAILIHQLSKKHTQNSVRKLHGLPVTSVFHPTQPILFVSTKKNVRVYDLLKVKLIKKLETKLREISSIAIHPGGDNVIVGSKEGKMCWFDMELSSQPYKTLKTHPMDITNVAFHRSYPLFASCSDDCTAYVFHGMVYSDLNQNPLIVPLEILRGHTTYNSRGVLDCKFHPRQPWLFTAGADSVIKLYCH